MSAPMSILTILDQPVWLLFLQLLISVQSLPELTFSKDLNNKVIFEGVEFPIEGERKVRDIISLHMGVPLDFSYNETVSSPVKLLPVSAPGCPKSHDGRPWLYFGSPPKCYLVGFQGPCPWGQRFFSVDNSKYGICNCDCFAGPSSSSPHSPSSPTTTPPEDLDIDKNLILPRRNSRSRMMSILSMGTGTRKFFYHPPSFYLTKEGTVLKRSVKSVEEPNRYKFCHSPSLKRQVVYDGLRQECFPFLEQGPCPSGEWLIKDQEKKNGVVCEKRKCPQFLGYNQPNSGGGFTYFDYKDQTCLTEVYGSLEESFFISANGILPNRQKFCQDAGMKYSQKLKTCVKDSSSMFDFKILG